MRRSLKRSAAVLKKILLFFCPAFAIFGTMRFTGYGKRFRGMLMKPIALVMITIMLAFCVSASCCNASAGDFGAGASVKAEQGVKAAHLTGCHDDCPSCPDHGDSSSHHCDSCSCPCHAALMHGPFKFISSSFSIAHESREPFRFLPDVYLSKFIPPQNLA